MVKHIVLFKLKSQNDRQRALDALNGMRGKIEGLLDIEVGSGSGFALSVRESEGASESDERSEFRGGCSFVRTRYDIALLCTLRDKAALDVYQEHPAHQPVKVLIRELCEASAAVDYET